MEEIMKILKKQENFFKIEIDNKDKDLLDYIYLKVLELDKFCDNSRATQDLAYFINGFYCQKYKKPLFKMNWIKSKINRPYFKTSTLYEDNFFFHFYHRCYSAFDKNIIVPKEVEEIINACVEMAGKHEMNFSPYVYSYYEHEKTAFGLKDLCETIYYEDIYNEFKHYDLEKFKKYGFEHLCDVLEKRRQKEK